jgi:hypothetical protein
MPVTQTQRNHMVRLAQLLNKYAPDVDYAQVRPMRTRTLTQSRLTTDLEHVIPVTMDCSESCTLISRLAGLRDPNGLQYDGEGYTGDMLSHLPHFTDANELHMGTFIVFGAFPGEHVVMVTTPATDNPEVYSHGSHANHAIWDLATERSYHVGQPLTFLAIEDL